NFYQNLDLNKLPPIANEDIIFFQLKDGIILNNAKMTLAKILKKIKQILYIVMKLAVINRTGQPIHFAVIIIFPE
ncbi:MAG: hypothetical protein UHW86_05495, partial [Spirochaetota bacterium]|nr:hypothetical protein [Spirochaetota bacterium]